MTDDPSELDEAIDALNGLGHEPLSPADETLRHAAYLLIEHARLQGVVIAEQQGEIGKLWNRIKGLESTVHMLNGRTRGSVKIGGLR
jgi:hypothetical protein